MFALNIIIFVIVYGRMLEIYIVTSLAPIPMATLANRELGGMGQNYIKSLFAIGFQGLLILVCVAIYAVLVQGIATSGDPIGAIWGAMGYTVLLCFMLFKTGSLVPERLRGPLRKEEKPPAKQSPWGAYSTASGYSPWPPGAAALSPCGPARLKRPRCLSPGGTSRIWPTWGT